MSLKTREGVELANTQTSISFFFMAFSQQAQVPGEEIVLSSADAKVFHAEVKDETGGSCAALTYEGLPRGSTAWSVPCEQSRAMRWHAGALRSACRTGGAGKGAVPVYHACGATGHECRGRCGCHGSAKGGVIRKPAR